MKKTILFILFLFSGLQIIAQHELLQKKLNKYSIEQLFNPVSDKPQLMSGEYDSSRNCLISAEISKTWSTKYGAYISVESDYKGNICILNIEYKNFSTIEEFQRQANQYFRKYTRNTLSVSQLKTFSHQTYTLTETNRRNDTVSITGNLGGSINGFGQLGSNNNLFLGVCFVSIAI
jgi:hypothetical protein